MPIDSIENSIYFADGGRGAALKMQLGQPPVPYPSRFIASQVLFPGWTAQPIVKLCFQHKFSSGNLQQNSKKKNLLFFATKPLTTAKKGVNATPLKKSERILKKPIAFFSASFRTFSVSAVPVCESSE